MDLQAANHVLTKALLAIDEGAREEFLASYRKGPHAKAWKTASPEELKGKQAAAKKEFEKLVSAVKSGKKNVHDLAMWLNNQGYRLGPYHKQAVEIWNKLAKSESLDEGDAGYAKEMGDLSPFLKSLYAAVKKGLKETQREGREETEVNLETLSTKYIYDLAIGGKKTPVGMKIRYHIDGTWLQQGKGYVQISIKGRKPATFNLKGDDPKKLGQAAARAIVKHFRTQIGKP